MCIFMEFDGYVLFMYPQNKIYFGKQTNPELTLEIDSIEWKKSLSRIQRKIFLDHKKSFVVNNFKKMQLSKFKYC